MANLLDRASVVLTPTAYNNGEALCIKPDDASGDFDFSRNSAATRVNAQGLVENVQILSSNLVQNGDFSEEGSEEVSNGSFTNGSTDWSLENGWSIGEDKAISDGSGSIPNTDLVQSNVFTTGKSYKVTLEIKDYVSGNLQLQNNTTNFPQSNGIHTIYSSTGSTSLILRSLSFIGSITNISVKEVGQNWDLSSSNISIGEDKLVCNNVLENNAIATQVNVIPVQKQVKVQFDIVVNSGSFRMLVGSGGTTTIVTTSGTYTFYETSGTGGNLNLQARSGGFDGSITNISVIEITEDTNLPRINYEGFSYDGSGNVVPDSGCGSWLFEPQSTNLITQSELFSDAVWQKFRVSITPNTLIAPNGKLAANSLIEDTTNNTHVLRYAITPNSNSYTFSVFVKSLSGNRKLVMNSSDVNSFAVFDIENGVIESEQNIDASSIEDYGNGWYRCSVTKDNNTSENFDIRLNNGSTNTYIGDGTSGVYIWGAMLEENSYPTSLIPTSGSTVTRNQDVCTNGGSLASINSTEGVLYAEIATNWQDVSGVKGISLKADANNYIAIYFRNSNFLSARIVGGGNVTQLDTTYSINTFYKVAVSYTPTSAKLYVNGSLLDTDTINTLPTGLNNLSFNRGGVGTGTDFEGKTKALAVWKEALSDQELAELTTI